MKKRYLFGLIVSYIFFGTSILYRYFIMDMKETPPGVLAVFFVITPLLSFAVAKIYVLFTLSTTNRNWIQIWRQNTIIVNRLLIIACVVLSFIVNNGMYGLCAFIGLFMISSWILEPQLFEEKGNEHGESY